MKKSTRIILITSVCLICVGIIFSVIGLGGNATWRKAVTGGMWDTVLFVSDDYDSAFREDGIYHADTDGADTINIDWYYGDISVEVYDGKDILICESAKEPLEKDTALRYKTEGGILEITSSAASSEVRFSPYYPSVTAEKELTVKIPKSFADQLHSLRIDTISSDIRISGLTLEKLKLSSEHGDFKGRGLKAETAEILLGEGSIKADFLTCPRNLSCDTNRGDCFLGLPKNSRADCTYYIENGRVQNGFRKGHGKHYGNSSGKRSRMHQGEMRIGDGGKNSFDLSVDTGDIRIFQGSCF